MLWVTLVLIEISVRQGVARLMPMPHAMENKCPHNSCTLSWQTLSSHKWEVRSVLRTTYYDPKWSKWCASSKVILGHLSADSSQHFVKRHDCQIVLQYNKRISNSSMSFPRIIVRQKVEPPCWIMNVFTHGVLQTWNLKFFIWIGYGCLQVMNHQNSLFATRVFHASFFFLLPICFDCHCNSRNYYSLHWCISFIQDGKDISQIGSLGYSIDILQ